MLTAFLFVFASLTILAMADFAGPRAKAVAICIAFFILLSLAAFRYMVPDYANYQAIFGETPELGTPKIFQQLLTIHGEYGYLLLNSTVKTLGGGFIVVSAIVALAAIYANFFAIVRLSAFPMLSIIYYFSHLYFNKELILARAGLASALVLLGLYAYINRRSLAMFVVCVASAAMFHAAALISLVMAFIFWARIRLTFLFSIVVIAFIFSLLNFYPTELFLSAMQHTNMLPNSVKTYVGYEGYDYHLGSLNPKSIQQLIVIVVLYRYRATLSSRIHGFNELFATYMVSTLVLISFSDFAILAARLATMLSNVEFILVPSLILLVPGRERALAYLAIVSLSLSMLLLNFSSGRMPDYRNYLIDSIFGSAPTVDRTRLAQFSALYRG